MIRKLLKVLGVSVLGLTSLLANADAARDLEAKLGKIQSLEANFSQRVIDELGNELDYSKGSFQLQRPMKFRWIVSEPYEQEIVSDGANLWQFDKDIEQINVSTLADSFDNSPAALLSKSQVDMEKDYIVASLVDSAANDKNSDDSLEQTYIFHLRPKSEEALFELMIMEFKGDEFVAFKVKDNLGQTTLVEFSEQQYNQEFSQGVFQFKPPAGIDLIDSREQLLDSDLTRPPELSVNG
ncbi:outer membrane lipoprotein chaperone LolA [Kangiella sp. TOML190]|uniref:outer membrane lipoprotein chaperone LolA n=1 Tax=Kangiella sp. TOML190 TaxID=2931351 RepID=UPI00203D7EA2|nr:outer membrane lipoprotein chaperone LolA [Kangiella sp. TOML190]